METKLCEFKLLWIRLYTIYSWRNKIQKLKHRNAFIMNNNLSEYEIHLEALQ